MDVSDYGQDLINAANGIIEQLYLRYNNGGLDSNGGKLPPEFEVAAKLAWADLVTVAEAYAGTPDPSSFDAPIAFLAKGMQAISSGDHAANPLNKTDVFAANLELAKLDSASTDMSIWSGRAAGDFRGYLNQLKFVRENQFLMLGVLKGALEAHKAAREQARSDVLQAYQGVYNAMTHSQGVCSTPAAWVLPLTVLAALATVGAELPEVFAILAEAGSTIPAPTLQTLGIAGVAAAADLAVAGISASQTVTVSAGAPYDVLLNALRDGTKKITTQLRQAEEVIVATLNHNVGALSGDHTQYLLPRPGLASVSANPRSPDYLGFAH
jgi:hypothetical protein